MVRRWLWVTIALTLILLLLLVYRLMSNNSTTTITDIAVEGGNETMTTQLHQAATMTFENYNPMIVVQAVNALQPLGKTEALNQIENYLQNEGANQDNLGLFWVLRVLFDVSAEQGFPPVQIGQPTIAPPTNRSDFPRYPIVIVQDVPLLVVNGYALGGLPENVQAHVDYYRLHGTLRSQPLDPASDVVAVKDEFMQQWRAVYGNTRTTEVQQTIDRQLSQ
jgi:hypothetical protein